MQTILKLEEAMRPRRFEDVVGQTDAVRWCIKRTTSQTSENAIFSGPVGCGKTSLALLLGRSLVCQSKQRTSIGPCGVCEACRIPLTALRSAFRDLNSAQIKPDVIENILERIRHPRLDDAQHVYHFDEAHELSRRCMTMLLKVLEHPRPDWTFLFSTSEPEQLPEALTRRCRHLKLQRVSDADMIAFGADVCRRANIRTDPIALSLLADQASGEPSALIRSISKVAERFGDVFENHVRTEFKLDIANDQELIGSIFDGDLSSAFKILPRIDRSAAETHAIVRRLLLGLGLDARHIVHDDPLYQKSDADWRQRLLATENRFQTRQRSIASNVFLDLEACWRQHACSRKADLSSLIIDSVALLDLHRIAPRGRGRSHSLRQRALKHDGDGRAHLNIKELRKIRDAASTLPQIYGRYLNARIIVDHGKLGVADQKKSIALVSRLIKQLTARLERWSGEQIHWLYAHACVSSGLMTTIVMHVPEAHADALDEWLFDSFVRREFHNGSQGGIRFRCVNSVSVIRQAHRHRVLLRLLCRSAEPNIRLGLYGPCFRDVFRVPARMRQDFKKTTVSQLYRVSKTIGGGLTRVLERDQSLPMRSLLDDYWTLRDPGWEYREYKWRNEISKKS